MHVSDQQHFSAIVLCRTGTGLATVRCLANEGVSVTAFIFDQRSATRFSRHCKKVNLVHYAHSEEELLNQIRLSTKQSSLRPVLLPTSDEHALFIAKYADELINYCLFATTSYEDLSALVNKNQLYTICAKAKVPTIPSVVEPSIAKLTDWSEKFPGPYFVKPFYEGVSQSLLHKKNMQFESRDELLQFVIAHGADALVIQQRISGGDGYIFDCYGYCDKDGKILSMASHRRWRQHLPDCGATCFGEIPANIHPEKEQALFQYTEQLLKKIRYHGIFGIEYLMNRDTEEFFLIDFNARPFLTIGHLADCGLNLPALACAELNQAAFKVERLPTLKHLYWVDLYNDIESYNEKRKSHSLGFWAWFKTLWQVNSFAYWDWRDPAPCLYRVFQIGKRGLLFGLSLFLGG